MKAAYLDMIRMIERLHRQCLELVKAEIEREGIRDLNNVQALILFNIGEGEVTVGELTQRGYYLGSNVSYRGYYLGSNVSYNVKKLVENGYLVQERSPHDRRSTHVRVSEKGMAIYKHLDRLFEHHAEAMSQAGLGAEDLNGASDILSRLLRYWSGPEHFSGRGYPGA